jgi:DNA-binding MarR family transcriptional regulator
MDNNRQKLVEGVIDEFSKAAHSMHANQNFPFGACMLGRQQLMILFFVFEKKGLASVKELSKFLKVTPGAITQFIDALVEKKLVKREENATDRRGINIKLTTSAEKQFNEFKKRYIINAGKAFETLSDNELKQFTKLLSKIKKNSD